MSLSWTPHFIDAVFAAFGSIEIGTFQPYDWLQFEPLFAKEFIAKIDEFVQKAKEQNIAPQEFAKYWPTTTSLRFAVYYIILQSKCAQIPQEKRVELAQFFFAILQARAPRDTYGFTSNICQTPEDIAGVLKNTFHRGSPETAKLLGKLYNALYNFCAGLYLDFYLDYCAENEGPYDVSSIYGPGHTLVIKKFVNMQTDVWSSVKIPYNTIYLYYVYKDVTFSCNMCSIHSVYEGDVIHGLVDYAVVADGVMINDTDALKKLLEQFSVLSVEQWQRLKGLSLYEQKLKGLQIKHYGMKRIFERVGIDGEPTQQMMDAVKAPFKDNTYWNVPQENAEQYWRRLYDPEDDFYPGDSL